MQVFSCFDHIAEPVFILDNTNQVIYVNSSFKELNLNNGNDKNAQLLSQFDFPIENWLDDYRTKFRNGDLSKIYTSDEGKNYSFNSIDKHSGKVVVVEKSITQDRLALRMNESLANAAAELISPSLSIDKIARVLFKSCLELTGGENGFVSFDDNKGDNILIHYFDERYLTDNRLSGNFLFMPREEYLNFGFYGYKISTDQKVYNKNQTVIVKRKIGSKSPDLINNCVIQPAIANDIFYGHIVLINAPSEISKYRLGLIEALAHVYAMAVFRKQMEWDLLTAKEKAEESDKLKSAFLANMSHEIRTPMNAIVGFSDMLVNNQISPEKKKVFSSLIQSSCNDLLYLVNDIIDISKIEAGMLKFHSVDFLLADLFTELYQIGKQKIETIGKQIELVYEEPDASILLYLDRSRLKQIMLNLIGNAIKFTHEGSVVFGYNFNVKDKITFYVRDSGIGISEEDQKYIFESFRQVDTIAARNYGGTGLGLSITKRLVEQMGGKIKVDSIIDKGSEFNFSIRCKAKFNVKNK